MAIRLVWETSAVLTGILAISSLIVGVLPAGIAYVGKLIVDAVVSAVQFNIAKGEIEYHTVVFLVICEAGLVIIMSGAQKVIVMSQSILRVLLGNKVNVMILEKALALELEHFEDSEYYDKLVRARREASSRPLGFVTKIFSLIKDSVSLLSYGALLFQFSPIAVVLLIAAGIPSFITETKFSGKAFKLHHKRSADRRMQIYLEMVLTREDGAKEVKLFQLGQLFLKRFIDIFKAMYQEERYLILRRGLWGYIFGLISSLAFYFAYGWVAIAAIAMTITIGQMTMYVVVFRQGQTAVMNILATISGMYEDNLYLSNLTEYLKHEVSVPCGKETKGLNPKDGIRFENVSFTYPKMKEPALKNITLHIKSGESLALVGENGSGKTTLIKLLTRLYTPTEGRILLEGLDLQEWDVDVLRRKIGVIFQDFARYQLLVGENIGIGDVRNLENKEQIQKAAREGLSSEFIEALPHSYETQLGAWFQDGKELSGGQWQKIALSRAFMRRDADILILDEPTAAIDAKAEAEIFSYFRNLTQGKVSIIISHRFSTVRMADQIIVIENGKIIEKGSHQSLLELEGQYAMLFKLQAKGYQ